MLFESRRVPLQLTPLGSELHALTQSIFATSEQIEDLLGQGKDGRPRLVRLVSDSPVYVARLAHQLLVIEPAIDLEVHIANAKETLVRLDDARADVALVSDPQIDERFFYKPLFVDELHVLLPRRHPRAHSGTYPLAALEHEWLLLREETSKTRAATESLLVRHGVQPRRVIKFNSREAIREAVAVGMGVSLLFASECPPDPRLIAVKPDQQPDQAFLTGYIACRTERRRSALMRQFYEAAAEIGIESSASRPGAGSSVKKASLTPPESHMQTAKPPSETARGAHDRRG